MSAKKSNAAPQIPEEIQESLRKILIKSRTDAGIQRKDVTSASPTTVVGWEFHDISTLKLGNLYALCQEYGVEFNEILMLFSGTVPQQSSEESVREQHWVTLFRLLNRRSQDLAIKLVDLIRKEQRVVISSSEEESPPIAISKRLTSTRSSHKD